MPVGAERIVLGQLELGAEYFLNIYDSFENCYYKKLIRCLRIDSDIILYRIADSENNFIDKVFSSHPYDLGLKPDSSGEYSFHRYLEGFVVKETIKCISDSLFTFCLNCHHTINKFKTIRGLCPRCC
jgi:hypothetical protein